MSQNFLHLPAGQNDWKALRTPRAHQISEVAGLTLQNVPVEEQNHCKGLRLRRGADSPGDREVGQEGIDLFPSELLGMSLFVEQNEVPNPPNVGRLGAPAVMARPKRVADTFPQSRLSVAVSGRLKTDSTQ